MSTNSYCALFQASPAPKFIGKLMFVRGERMCVWVGEGVEESALEACIHAINTLHCKHEAGVLPLEQVMFLYMW